MISVPSIAAAYHVHALITAVFEETIVQATTPRPHRWARLWRVVGGGAPARGER